jgi:hypothetical protein
MKRTITVTESELINSIEKIVKEQTATLGFGNTNGFNNLGMGLPTNKHRELGETGTNYNMTMDKTFTSQDGSDDEDAWMSEEEEMELDELYENDELEEDCLDEDCGGSHNEELEENWFALWHTHPHKKKYEPKVPTWESKYTRPTVSENIANLVRNELLETQAKEAKKWIQGAVKRPGALRKKLGVGKGKDISLAMIDKKMKQIKSNDTNKKKKGVQGLTKADLRTYKQLNLAKTLKRLAKKKHASDAKRFVKK